MLYIQCDRNFGLQKIVRIIYVLFIYLFKNAIHYILQYLYYIYITRNPIQSVPILCYNIICMYAERETATRTRNPLAYTKKLHYFCGCIQ